MIRNKAYRPSTSAQLAPSSSTSRAQELPPKSTPSIPCKYLMRPLHAFSPKISSFVRCFSFDENLPTFSGELQHRFGKKVICVEKPKDMTRANHHHKFFKELGFDKNRCERSSFKCIGDKVVLDPDITFLRLNAFQRKKLVSSALKKITLNDNSDLLLLKNTRTVTHLNMKMNGNLAPKLDKAIFRNLRCLETFTFELTPSSEQMIYNPAVCIPGDEYLAFFSELTQLKNLKFLYLNFTSYFISSDFLVNLVTVLEQRDTYRWYLRARIFRFALYDSLLPSGIFERIDFLGLNMRTNHFGRDLYHGPPGLDESKQILSQKKRILDLLFKIENVQDKIDMNLLLNRCESLEGIYIKSIGETLKWVEDVQYVKVGYYQPLARKTVMSVGNNTRKSDATAEKIRLLEEERLYQQEEKRNQKEFRKKMEQVEQENEKRIKARKKNLEEEKQKAEWISRLTDITLSFHMETEMEEKDTFDCFLEAIKEKSRNLRSLNLFYCGSDQESGGYRGDWRCDRYEGCYYSSTLPSKGVRSDSVYAFSKNLQGLESLENLELSVTEFDKSLTHLLLSLRNLKKFTMNMYATKNSMPWDEHFQFSGLAHVREFKLVINCGVKEVVWGKNLIKELVTLKHLQSIEIIDKTRMEMSLSLFCGFMAALCQLKELRKVLLWTQISKERMYDDTEHLLPEEAQTRLKEARKAILEGIKNYVKYLAESMENIEEIDIREVKCYNIGQIYYKKKKNEIDLT